MKSAMIKRWITWEVMNQYPTYYERRLIALSVFSYAYVKIQKMMKRTLDMACVATKCEVYD